MVKPLILQMEKSEEEKKPLEELDVAQRFLERENVVVPAKLNNGEFVIKERQANYAYDRLLSWKSLT
ncbi:hypothetical protein AAVH_24063 [Aphelenchoides avenae]|nr:hypothetical protein AAVH_24063 [Aphelenchus avenae]